MKNYKSVLKKLLFTVMFAFLVAALVPSVSSIDAQARTKKISAVTNYKKAPGLIKGTNKITAKKNSSYTKFKAPADGKYTITVSNIATIGRDSSQKDHNLGNFYIQKLVSSSYSSYLTSVSLKTQGKGKKQNLLWMATKDSYDDFESKRSSKTTSYLPKRSTTLNLKKGETLYFRFYYTGVKSTYTVNIKKK